MRKISKVIHWQLPNQETHLKGAYYLLKIFEVVANLTRMKNSK